MVTLQLLNQHEQEKGESSNEEEEEEDEAQPRSPSGQSQAPLDGERQEPPAVLSERVVQEESSKEGDSLWLEIKGFKTCSTVFSVLSQQKSPAFSVKSQ